MGYIVKRTIIFVSAEILERQMLEKGKQAQGCQKVFKKQADND